MKRHSRSQSSASSSQQYPMSKTWASNKDSIRNPIMKSKYFAPNGESEATVEVNAKNRSCRRNLKETLQDANEESPYKSAITEVKNFTVNTSVNDDRDFKTPKLINKATFKNKLSKNSARSASNNSRAKKPKDTKRSKQMVLIKKTAESCDDGDVNPEHLQLALALSRSLHDSKQRENKEGESALAPSSAYPSTQQKIATIRETLEQFGLKADTNKINVQNRRPPLQKKKKNTRFQYITPVLLLRTQEDRDKIISDKINSILSNNERGDVRCSKLYPERELASINLQKYRRRDTKMFRMSNFELEILKDEFYVKCLNISITKAECGHLLKDWSKIPGRDASPLRLNTGSPMKPGNDLMRSSKTNSLDKPLENKLKIDSFRDGGISPDLFDSDDEVIDSASTSLQPKQSLQESTASEDDSPSLLKLTPFKNKSAQLTPDASSEECSESLLNITPTKKKTSSPNKNKVGLDDTLAKNSSFRTSSEDKLSDLSDDDLFENDNGICTFESFSVPPQNCFDLTQSSSDENGDNENTATNFSKQSSNMEQTCADVANNQNSVTEKLKKTQDCDESSIFNNDSIVLRRNGSLNVTDYICKMLTDEQDLETELQLPKQNFEANEDDVLNLTQDSTDSLSSDHRVSNESSTIHGRERASSSSTTTSPIKPHRTNFNEENATTKLQKHESFTSTTSDDVNLSQESIYVSDEELNYSSVYGTPCNNQTKRVRSQKELFYEFPEASDDEQNNFKESSTSLDYTPRRSDKLNSKEAKATIVASSTATDQMNNTEDHPLLQHPRITNLSRERTKKSRKSLFDERPVFGDTTDAVIQNDLLSSGIHEDPLANDDKEAVDIQNETKTTPKSEMIIKTAGVTPRADYTDMDTPTVTKELQKFGLKPLKRQRGVQILKHIYESTHPVVESSAGVPDESDTDDQRVIKKRKIGAKVKNSKIIQSPGKKRSPKTRYTDGDPFTEQEMEYANENSDDDENRRAVKRKTKVKGAGTSRSPKKSKSPKKREFEGEESCFGTTLQIEIVGNLMGENETVEDLIFERKQSSKIPSCKVPLHIAWHNLVSSQPELRKNILLYEPLQLEVLYTTLKEQGYKYHIQDLLTFLDKKCITIRTNQGSNRPRKRRKKLSPSKRGS